MKEQHLSLMTNCNFSFALDPLYATVLWSYDPEGMRISAYADAPGREDNELEPGFLDRHRRLMRATELCVPTEADVCFTDCQQAIFILSTVYSMSVYSASSPPEGGNVRRGSFSDSLVNGRADNRGFSVVNRFETYGGGWGYSAHSVEAVQFKVSTLSICPTLAYRYRPVGTSTSAEWVCSVAAVNTWRS